MDPKFWRHKTTGWVSHTIELMDGILKKVGPRPSGSPESRETASILGEAIAPYVDKLNLESFQFGRKPFLSFLKWQSATYVLAVAALFLNWIGIAAILMSVGLFVTVAQFVFYKELLDPLYPKTEGVNMVAVVEPDGPVQRQVILSGHHDSAFVFRFLQWNPRLYPIHVLFANLFIWVAAVAIPVWAVLQWFDVVPFYSGVLPWILAAGVLFVGPLAFLVSSRCTPGAGDNLVASAGVVALAKALAQERALGTFALRNTRVWFVSFDAEESGLRGARAFVKRHLAELKEAPAELLNIDSIYEVKDLRFVVRDINGTMPLSKSVGQECVDVAKSLGFASSILSMPLGSGATDAGEFARVGIPATTMIAMSSGAIPPKGFPYHTLRDTLEVVKPEAIKAMLEVYWAMLVRRESQVEGAVAPMESKPAA